VLRADLVILIFFILQQEVKNVNKCFSFKGAIKDWTDIYQIEPFVQFQLIPPLAGLKATIKKMKVIIIFSSLFHRNQVVLFGLIWQLSCSSVTNAALLRRTAGERV